MAYYEHVLIARPEISPQQVDALVEDITKTVKELGGAVGKTEYWGLRNLTYRIRKNRKAHMTLLNIDAPAPALAEMERQMRLSEDIIRYLTIRVDELEEGPSAMMRKVDRDRERDDGRPGAGGPRGDRGGDRGSFRDRDRRPSRDGDDVAAVEE